MRGEVNTLTLTLPLTLPLRLPLTKAIEKAERGDFGEIERLLQLLRRPYDDHGYLAAEAYAAPPPDWLQDTALT